MCIAGAFSDGRIPPRLAVFFPQVGARWKKIAGVEKEVKGQKTIFVFDGHFHKDTYLLRANGCGGEVDAVEGFGSLISFLLCFPFFYVIPVIIGSLPIYTLAWHVRDAVHAVLRPLKLKLNASDEGAAKKKKEKEKGNVKNMEKIQGRNGEKSV